jgi:hypothetical protein
MIGCPPPTGLTVVPQGTLGTTAYGYAVTTTDQFGESAPTATVSISNGGTPLGWTTSPSNILPDPSFEGGGVASWVAGTNGTVANSTAQAYDGTHSLAVTCTAGSTSIVTLANRTVSVGTLTVGQLYTFSAWVFVPATNRCGIKLAATVPAWGQSPVPRSLPSARGGSG